MMCVSNKTITEKIDQAIVLESKIKEDKKQLEALKAELQSELYADMINKNTKFVQEASSLGLCNVAVKHKMEVDNPELLYELFGSILDGKMTKKEHVDYEVDSNLKKAFIALYQQDYAKGDIESLLIQLGLSDKERKVAMKKLSGDYAKDLALLQSFGVQGELEEELDLIHGQKNYEAISRYLDAAKLDDTFLQKLKLAIYVEESLSIGLVAVE